MRPLSKRHHRRASQGEARPCEGRRQVNAPAAGGDIGAHEIVAGVPDGAAQQSVRTFGPDTAALDALAHCFGARGIQTGALASTGV